MKVTSSHVYDYYAIRFSAAKFAFAAENVCCSVQPMNKLGVSSVIYLIQRAPKHELITMRLQRMMA